MGSFKTQGGGAEPPTSLSRPLVPAVLCLLLLAAQGCALSNETVKLAYLNAEAPKGALADLGPLRFQVGEFKDVREDARRVGRRRNSLRLDLANIYSNRPLGHVVQEAVGAELVRSRQKVVDKGADAVVRGEIRKMFVDTTMSIFLGALVYSELDAEAEIYVELCDAGSGKVLYSHSYPGREHLDTEPIQSQYEKVLNAALSEAIATIGMDRALVDALAARSRRAAAP